MTDSSRVFQLDRLYAGSNDGPGGSVDVVARTPGVSPDQLTECRRLANLMPPPPAQRTDDMPGSLGLFRGESSDYILAKAQQGTSGAPQYQFVLMPAAPLRLLGGNIRTFEAFAREPMPRFAAPRADLPLFVLEHPEPADIDTQIDDLLTLIGYCKNNTKVVGGLIAGLVQAMGIGVINAPFSIRDRLTFIQGLLTLLPAPVRASITFATSVIDPGQTNAQIKFLASDTRPARHLIFDWTAGKLLNDAPNDSYSHFIMAQLRLDPALVIEQTQKLERTAIWRTLRKDDLANALAWASKRASLDSAIMNGLAADPQMVAGVLREDPTLPDEMRVAYAKHLLAFALTLNEPERADVLIPVTARFGNVADAIYEQLKYAAQGERSEAVYALVARWVLNASDLDAARWRPLLAVAALTSANRVIASGDTEKICAFLESFLDAPPALQLDVAMAHVIGVSRKAAYENLDIARLVFLLGVTFLPAGGLQRLLTEASFVARLPGALRAVFPHLSPNAPRPAPHGLLTHAAQAFGEERRPIVLARLAEWSILIQRIDLIDADVLAGLIEVGRQPLGARFDILIQHIIQDLSQLPVLRTLDPLSVQRLVALSLVRERFKVAVAQLEFYQNTLYRGMQQDELGETTQRIFRETPLTIPQLNGAFAAMQDSQLRALTRAHAYLGALLAHDWSPELGFAIRRLTAILSNDASLIPMLGIDHTLRLVKANADQHDVVETLRLASALVENALLLGPQGTDLVNQVYALINWGPEVTASAMEVLRAYVRRAPLSQAKMLSELIGKQQGEDIMKALDATYRLRVVLGSSDFASFAEQVAIGTQLLTDMATTYHESQEVPAIHKLRRTVESMPGGLSDTERERLASNLFRMAYQILQLGRNRLRGMGRQETAALVVQNAVAPGAGVDALRWIGGHFASQAVQLRLERADQPHLLGSRSVNILLRETDTLVALFDNLLAAFPEGTPPLDNQAFRAEVDSLWALLSLHTQRQIRDSLGENAQLLADLICVVGDKGNERSLAANGFGLQLARGRAQPRTVIDALRWINGYFLKQHTY